MTTTTTSNETSQQQQKQQQIEACFPEFVQRDGNYVFLRGKDANLQSLHSCTTHEKIIVAASKQRDEEETTKTNGNGIINSEDGDMEKLLCYIKPVSVSIKNSTEDFEGIIGQLIITTKRILFTTNDRDEVSKDFAIDAQCITLHAMMSEPDISVYCQLADNNDEYDEDYVGPMEIFFSPQFPTQEDDKNETDSEDKTDLSQILFESLTQLINLNPVYDDDDNDGYGGGAGGLMAMLGMMGGDDAIDNDNDEMICRIDPHEITNKQTYGDELTSEERSRKLERLDNLLVVPPEYEIEGQFDDADENEQKEDAKHSRTEDMDNHDDIDKIL